MTPRFGGLLVGAASFLIIGLLHPVVIKAEYRYGKGCWPLFAAAGALCYLASVFMASQILSILLAVLGFTLFWCVRELYEQEERVKKGWFPANPDRRK